ncbi:MAG: energy-coupling factor transporter transmembrane component T [bacterium]
MRVMPYRPGPSALHALDPRVKLAAAAIGFAAVLLFSDPVFLAWPLAGLFVLAALGRVLRPFLVATAVCAVVSVFSFAAWTGLLALRGQSGPEAWVYGLGIAVRLLDMVLLGVLLLFTTRTEELLAALLRLGLPFPAVFALGLTFRLVPGLLAAAVNVVEAQRLRGLRFDEGGLVTRARRYVPLLVPILAGALRSAHRMAWALEAKGFGSGGRRTSFVVLAMKPADWGALALVCAGGAWAAWARARGLGVLAFRGL